MVTAVWSNPRQRFSSRFASCENVVHKSAKARKLESSTAGKGCVAENTYAYVPAACTPPRSVPSPREKVVGNAYTTAEERPSEAGSDTTEVWVEMGLRVKDIRVRCVFQYDRDESGTSFKRMFLVREGLERLPLDNAETEVKCVFFFCPCRVVLFWHCPSLSCAFFCLFFFASNERLGEACGNTELTGSCERDTQIASHLPSPPLRLREVNGDAWATIFMLLDLTSVAFPRPSCLKYLRGRCLHGCRLLRARRFVSVL